MRTVPLHGLSIVTNGAQVKQQVSKDFEIFQNACLHLNLQEKHSFFFGFYLELHHNLCKGN
jgi:hypothetical protein